MIKCDYCSEEMNDTQEDEIIRDREGVPCCHKECAWEMNDIYDDQKILTEKPTEVRVCL